jgi:hypothetical protein
MNSFKIDIQCLNKLKDLINAHCNKFILFRRKIIFINKLINKQIIFLLKIMFILII